MRVFGLFYRGEGKQPTLNRVEWFTSLAAARSEFERRITGQVSTFRWLDTKRDEADHRVMSSTAASLVLYDAPPVRRGRTVRPLPLGRWKVGPKGAPKWHPRTR